MIAAVVTAIGVSLSVYYFEWKKKNGTSAAALARLRGDGSHTPEIGTIRGNYVRTAVGWALRVRGTEEENVA